jgi:3-deoxy-D-manno-octulosonic-acid transferase
MWLNLYSILLWLGQPLYWLRLYWRGRSNPGYRQHWRERTGHITLPVQPGSVWIHAVSVGETQAIAPLIHQIQTRHPTLPLYLTQTTPTGRAQAERLFGHGLPYSYLPYDLPRYLRRFLHTLRPRALILVETELWPNLLSEAARQGIPVYLVNARLSARSQAGYQRLRHFTRQAVVQLTAVAAQTSADAARLHSLGIPESKIQVTGNLKYDQPLPDQQIARTLRRTWPRGPIWIAASTHAGEDEIMLAAHTQLRQIHPGTRLILVPRHPERFAAVATSIRHSGHDFVRRSQGESLREHTSVYLADTMGELSTLLGTADIAFIGGSLVPVGGHNMLEAVAQGVPVCFGPHTFHFADIARQLRQCGAAQQVEDATHLAATLSHWLSNPLVRQAAGQAGQDYVQRNQGAVERLYQQLYPLLCA